MFNKEKSPKSLSGEEHQEALQWLTSWCGSLGIEIEDVAHIEAYGHGMAGLPFPTLVISPKNLRGVHIAVQARVGSRVNLLFDFIPWMTGLDRRDEGDMQLLVDAVNSAIRYGVLKRKRAAPKLLSYENESAEQRFILRIFFVERVAKLLSTATFEAVASYYED